jgi:hypothetical protein
MLQFYYNLEKEELLIVMINIIKRVAAVFVSTALVFSINVFDVPQMSASADSISAVWPVDPQYQRISTYFDPQRNINNVSGYHNGLDIEADGGSPIYAVRDGVVISSDWKDAYGNMAIVYHEDIGVYTFYAHASSLVAQPGAHVKQGEVIAYVGTTGSSTGNHLHIGICDNLLSGWPTVTYYDPLTYFDYSGAPASYVEEECECSEEYAGIYKTKGVTTYLNIRSGHGSDYPVKGEIPAGAEVRVTKANSEWAHVEYNGVRGYSSMEFLEKVSDIESKMTIDDVSAPEGELSLGEKFVIKGKIKSEFPISKIWGGVYNSDGSETSQTVEASPNTFEYDLSGYFNNRIVFGKLETGDYIYEIKAADSTGKEYSLVKSEFKISETETKITAGDVNLDGEVNVSDFVMLQSYLLGRTDISEQQKEAADVNTDGSVNVFDLIIIKRIVMNKVKK